MTIFIWNSKGFFSCYYVPIACVTITFNIEHTFNRLHHSLLI